MTGFAKAFIVSILLFAHAGLLAAAPLTVGADATVLSVLTAQQGNRVTIRLHSGEELTGTVAAVNGALVQLSQLAGKEFFDAVIAMDAVAAIVIRTRDQ